MQLRSYISRFVLIGAALMLSACSYFDTGEDLDVSHQPQETVDLMNGGGYQNTGDVSYQDVVRNNSNGSVEIYSLDVPLPTDVPTYAPSPQPTIQPSMQMYMNEVERQDLSNEPYYLSDGGEGYSLDGGATSYNVEEEPIAPVSSDGGLHTVYFDFGSAKLDQSDLEIVQDVARSFDSSNGVGFDVMGHASVDADIDDPVERKILNLKQSMERAYAVAAALIRQGVPAEALRVSGWGEVRPPLNIPPGMDADEASRRVEIFSGYK